MGLMIAGGIAGSISGNSAGSVSNACKQWQGTLDNYNKFACNWKNIINSGNINLDEVKQLNTGFIDESNNYKEGLSKMKDAFKQQELSTVIGISILIFIILISLLTRYFNVYGMIWSFIVN